MPDNNKKKEKTKNKNILVTDYEKLSEVVRLLYVYGCYSNVDFNDPELREKINNSLINSESEFRKKREAIDVILENAVKNTRNTDSKKQYYISPNRFDKEVTSLVKIYRLCVLKSMKNPIMDYINFLYTALYPRNDAIKITNRKKMIEYFGEDTKKDSLFFLDVRNTDSNKLSFEELSQLHSAIMFFNGKAPYSVPGYMACDRINDYLKLSGKEPVSSNADTIFNYNNIDRILNDNAVYDTFEAIKQKKWISFNFRKTEVNALKNLSKSELKNNKKRFCGERKYCCPLRVMYEFQNGRGYLIGWASDYKGIRIYRLDDIFDVEMEDEHEFEEIMSREKAEELFNEEADKIWISKSKKYAGNVVIDFDENAEYIRKLIPIGTVIPVSDNLCRLETRVANFKDIVPFIRRFGETAHISKEKSPELYEYVKDDLRKALEKYEAI